MKQLTPLQNLIYRLGALLMVAGLCLWLFLPQVAVALYGVGSVAYALMQTAQSYEGRSIVVRRLRHQQLIGALCLVAVAVCMAMQAWHIGPLLRNEWMACLAIGAMLQCYTAWRIPAELDKESK